jgi:hypothetical protein
VDTDNESTDGFYPTMEWWKDEIVRDQYDLTIPLDAPPGGYQIEVGLYMAGTGERLPVIGPQTGQGADRVLIGEIQVEY